MRYFKKNPRIGLTLACDCLCVVKKSLLTSGYIRFYTNFAVSHFVVIRIRQNFLYKRYSSV